MPLLVRETEPTILPMSVSGKLRRITRSPQSSPM
jgi:hypothetical protein